MAGRRTFRQVSAGRLHVCAVTPSYKAYCWGTNRNGQVGDSTTALLRRRPALVAGGHPFVQIAAGAEHTCAVTSDDRAYCWGHGGGGALGDGQTSRRLWPSAVAGSLSFTRVTAGVAHSCGETTGHAVYCWGDNKYGELGDATNIDRSTPVALAGGLAFAQVSAEGGGVHTCGKTRAGLAYCWGLNNAGQLGEGTNTGPESCAESQPCSTRPVAVIAPKP